LFRLHGRSRQFVWRSARIEEFEEFKEFMEFKNRSQEPESRSQEVVGWERDGALVIFQ
jgi:hypothetical protein